MWWISAVNDRWPAVISSPAVSWTFVSWLLCKIWHWISIKMTNFRQCLGKIWNFQLMNWLKSHFHSYKLNEFEPIVRVNDTSLSKEGAHIHTSPYQQYIYIVWKVKIFSFQYLIKIKFWNRRTTNIRIRLG